MVLDGNISIYSYESDEEKISDAILKPQYLPDNYRLNEEKITDTTSVLEYGNDKKHLIFQQTIVTNEKMIFDTNYNSVEQIRINGMTVFLYRYTDETFWAYGEYGNSVYVLAGDTIQKEEIEKYINTGSGKGEGNDEKEMDFTYDVCVHFRTWRMWKTDSYRKAEETETADSMKEDTTELCAYIKEINGNTLVIDPVEYISSGDSDRLASYKHTDDDMPDGYYIYNKDEKQRM